jgi:hypothetical protein
MLTAIQTRVRAAKNLHFKCVIAFFDDHAGWLFRNDNGEARGLLLFGRPGFSFNLRHEMGSMPLSFDRVGTAGGLLRFGA